MNRVSVLLITFMMLAVAYGITGASGENTAGMHIEGPSIAATNTTVTYRVMISGIFDVYRCVMLMAGENLSGASPLNQVEKVSYNGVFRFDITTPNSTQRIYLDFKAYGTINSTGKTKIFHRRIYVDIKKAYTIVATVKNPTNYTIYNVTVNFYIDGRYVGNSTIEKIGANSTAKATYNWVPDVADGEHTLTVKLVGNGVVFENNEKSYSRTIYVGNPPNYDWVGYLGIGVLIALAALFPFVLLGRRKGRGVKKPKWKS